MTERRVLYKNVFLLLLSKPYLTKRMVDAKLKTYQTVGFLTRHDTATIYQLYLSQQ
ncbi:MAG: hypothetical protein K0S75_2541 [Clostridia bacterium]|jgi:hypothetical protein|nr:hypothetical protein [Clostridia bacterium]